MTDYKNLKLIASSSPHIRSNEDTRSIMLDVIIALLPALAWSVYCFGWKALLLTAVSVVSCVFFEWAYRKVMKKSCMVGDLSAVVTGILLSFVCPVDLPWWVIIIGAFFSIVVVKQLYGGIGCNFLNPALAGRAFLLASYATWMTTWAIPQIRPDVTSAATPMAIMKEGTEEAFTTLMSNYSIGDMFLGKVGGSLGEVSALCLLVGGVYLLIRKVISWQIPVAYIGTVAILTLIAAPAGIDNVQYMLYNVFGGGLMLGAIFMATDYATSPVTKPGQLIFGLGCGLLTCFIRRFGSYPEGVCYFPRCGRPAGSGRQRDRRQDRRHRCGEHPHRHERCGSRGQRVWRQAGHHRRHDRGGCLSGRQAGGAVSHDHRRRRQRLCYEDLRLRLPGQHRDDGGRGRRQGHHRHLRGQPR